MGTNPNEAIELSRKNSRDYRVGDYVLYHKVMAENSGVILDIDRLYDHETPYSLRQPHALIRLIGGTELSVNISDPGLRPLHPRNIARWGIEERLREIALWPIA